VGVPGELPNSGNEIDFSPVRVPTEAGSGLTTPIESKWVDHGWRRDALVLEGAVWPWRDGHQIHCGPVAFELGHPDTTSGLSAGVAPQVNRPDRWHRRGQSGQVMSPSGSVAVGCGGNRRGGIGTEQQRVELRFGRAANLAQTGMNAMLKRIENWRQKQPCYAA